ncbi:unnamed protein product [Darwinula stevensoni]|uniref:PH domain-containing protein n=1 Tax=Darwinula stevensoni TaxID=69355 RepID=A0A7R9A2N9_9CRUS|nr:unnamed protein product [Darwinula stevensoni]CAG0889074.1 unnamed protein product [Darwinula stevensoni]
MRDIAVDWSDHGLWWPERNKWLTRTRSTLDQYSVQADAQLHFTPMHKMLRIQLPDLRYLDVRVDFSVKVFKAVIILCKELGIRHPEELSLQKPLYPDDLRYNYVSNPNRRRSYNRPAGADTNTFIAAQKGNSANNSTNSLDRSHRSFVGTPIGSPMNTSGTWRVGNHTPNYSPYNTMNGTMHTSFDGLNGSSENSLARSPLPSDEAKASLVRPKSLVERARMNVAWLDSSLSIMEQGIEEYNTLLLRYKFYSFYDLNPKYDAVRINQIFEQAKWQLLDEEIDCTEEEMLMFAALQLQVNLQANMPQSDANNTADDDIDAALTDLQTSLEGTAISSGLNDITQIPELSDYLRFMKPKKFTLKSFKRYWFTCKDLQLYLYKERGDIGTNPVHHINLKGCEVTPDVNLSQGKFGIKLEVPSQEGMAEMWIRCDNENQYARWMAACRLAAKGKSLADSSYDSEVKSIQAFLAMQHPAPVPAINPNTYDINPQDYVSQRFLRKSKGKLVQRILEAHANVKGLSLVDAKLSFIRAWQSLPDYGVSLFIVNFIGSKKEELLGVAFNKLMRMDPHTGNHIKTWRFNTMKSWHINWEVKQMIVEFDEEKVVFSCLSADCKVVHEFIGGYIFLSMRAKDVNQTLNEELFHKLTGGWV